MSFDYLREPNEITKRSFETILDKVDFTRIPEDLLSVAVRLVHACAIPEITNDISWSEGAAMAGEAALKAGAPILCDSEMVAHGIILSRLPAGNEIVCALRDPEVAARAAAQGTTRSAAAVGTWIPRLDGAVAVIGNAPTALFRVLEIIGEGAPKPAVILGFPVGFIGAAESKEALIRQGAENALSFITLRGRLGGSALAAAAVNALARSALFEEGEDEEETLFAWAEKQ